VAPRRPEQAVDRRGADGEELFPDSGVKGQMAMAFQGLDEAGQNGLKSFAADAVGGSPEDEEGLADGLAVGAPVERHWLRRMVGGVAKQSDGMLAMATGYGHELVEDLRSLGLGGSRVTLAQGAEEFGPRCLAHGGWHRVPPRVGNILLRQRAAVRSHRLEATTHSR
jgi:hypothetical protein